MQRRKNVELMKDERLVSQSEFRERGGRGSQGTDGQLDRGPKLGMRKWKK